MQEDEILNFYEAKAEQFFGSSTGYDQELTDFVNNPANIPFFRKALDIPNRRLKFYQCMALALYYTVPIECTKWEKDVNLQVITWILQKFKTEELDDFISRQLSYLVPKIMTTALAAYDDLNSSIMQDISTLFDQSPTQIMQGLMIFNELYEDINAKNCVCRDFFTANYGDKMFIMALSQARQFSQLKVINYEYAAKLLKAALECCKKILTTPAKRNEKSKTTINDTCQLPSKMNPIISNPETLITLFEIYKEILPDVKTIGHTVLEAHNCIRAYCQIAQTNFSQNLMEFLRVLTMEVNSIIGENWGAEIEPVEHISNILFAASPKFTMRDMPNIPNFEEFITRFSQATVSMLANGNYPFDNEFYIKLEGSLGFAAKLFSTAKATTGNPQFVGALAATVAPVCLQFLEWIANAEIHSDIELSSINVASHVQILIASDPAQISGLIIRNIIHFTEMIKNRAQIPPQEIHKVEMKLGIFFSILSRCLVNQMPAQYNISEMNYHIHMFATAMNVINESVAWLQEGERMIFLEFNIISFISSINDNHNFSPLSKTQERFFQMLNDIGCPINNIDASSNLMGSRLYVTFQCYGNGENQKEIKLINEAIRAMSILSRCPAQLEVFVHNTNEANFPFQQTMRRARYLFYQKLFSILYEKDLMEGIIELLRSVENRKAQTVTEDILRGISIDIRGLFMAAKSEKSWNILFDWFFDAWLQFFVDVFQDLKDPFTIFQVLKMFSVIVQQTGSKIKFPPSSPRGNILFEKVVQIINPVLELSTNDFDNEIIPLKLVCYCARVFLRMIDGGYVCIDAFKVYGLSTFSDTLGNFFNIISADTFMPILFKFVKFIKDIAQFFQQICKKQMNAIAEAPEIICLIVEFCNNILTTEIQADCRDTCYYILQDIARFIVDETYMDKDVNDDVKMVCLKATRILWNMCFSGPGNMKADSVLLIADPLKLFLILYSDTVNEALEAINNSLSEDRRAAFMLKREEFTSNLLEELEDEKARISTRLQKLTIFVQNVGVKVIIPIETE